MLKIRVKEFRLGAFQPGRSHSAIEEEVADAEPGIERVRGSRFLLTIGGRETCGI